MRNTVANVAPVAAKLQNHITKKKRNVNFQHEDILNHPPQVIAMVMILEI